MFQVLLHSKCNSSSALMQWTANSFFACFCYFCCSFSKWNNICVILLFLFEMEQHFYTFTFCCSFSKWNITFALSRFAVPFRNGTALLYFHVLLFLFEMEQHLHFHIFCVYFCFFLVCIFFVVPYTEHHFLFECFCCSLKKTTLWEYFWGQPFPFSCGIIHSSAQPHSPDSLSWHEVHYFYEDKNYGFFWSELLSFTLWSLTGQLLDVRFF